MMTQHLKTFAQNVLPNTFIGGVATTINAPELLADKLSIAPSRITGFKVIGTDIECKITGSYGYPNNFFRYDSQLTYYKDLEGLITIIGSNAFDSCPNLVRLELHGLKAFPYGLATNCNSLIYVYLPNVVSESTSNSLSTNSSLTVSNRYVYVNKLAMTAINGEPLLTLRNTNYNVIYIGYENNYDDYDTEVLGAQGNVNKRVLLGEMGLADSLAVNYQELSDRVRFKVLLNTYKLSSIFCNNKFYINGFNDLNNKVVELPGNMYFAYTNTPNLKLDGVTNITGINTFRYWTYGDYVEMASLKTISGSYIIRNTKQGFRLIAPNLEVITGPAFYSATSTLYDYKKLKQIGNDPAVDNQCFYSIPANSTINCNIALATVNNGGLNASLAYAKNSRNATINFYDNDGNYVSTL